MTLAYDFGTRKKTRPVVAGVALTLSSLHGITNAGGEVGRAVATGVARATSFALGRSQELGALTAASTASRYDKEALASGDDEFTEYEAYDFANWDLAGAEPITRETIRAARRFRDRLPRAWPRADIAPAHDGTIGFQWRIGGESVLDFVCVSVGPGEVIETRFIRADGAVEDLPPTRLSTMDLLMGPLDRALG